MAEAGYSPILTRAGEDDQARGGAEPDARQTENENPANTGGEQSPQTRAEKTQKGWGPKKKKNVQRGVGVSPVERRVSRKIEDFRSVVRKKICKARPKLSESERERMVLILSDPEKMKETYFGDLIKNVCPDNSLKPASRGTSRSMLVSNPVFAAEELDCIRVNLFIHQLASAEQTRLKGNLSRFKPDFDYGPFRAALAFEGVVFEWDESDLVIPRFLEAEKEVNWRKETVITDVHYTIQGDSCRESVCISPATSGASNFTNKFFEVESEDIATGKFLIDEIINALVQLAVQYNTKYFHSLYSNNCQHFIRDSFNALDAEEEKEKFEERIEKHSEMLVDGNDYFTECNTHQELDTSVRKGLETSSTCELERHVCQYHLLHSFGRAAPEKMAYRCPGSLCQLASVEKRLEALKNCHFT